MTETKRPEAVNPQCERSVDSQGEGLSELDCPKSSPGPVQSLFAGPGPGPKGPGRHMLDLDLDLSGPGPGPVQVRTWPL